MALNLIIFHVQYKLISTKWSVCNFAGGGGFISASILKSKDNHLAMIDNEGIASKVVELVLGSENPVRRGTQILSNGLLL